VGPWSSAGVESITESTIGADNLQWEKALKANLGIEANFIKNKLQVVFDILQRPTKRYLHGAGTDTRLRGG